MDIESHEQFFFAKLMSGRTYLSPFVIYRLWTMNWNPIPYCWYGAVNQMIQLPCNIYMIPGC